MFGSKEASEDKLKKMVEKGKTYERQLPYKARIILHK